MSLTEAQLHAAFDREYPGRNWYLKCQAAFAQACRMAGDGSVVYYLTANIGRSHSGRLNMDASKAPMGAAHFFTSGGAAGHIAGGLGGSRVFMASAFVDIKWGDHLGVTTVERYVKRTGCRYLGWAKDEGSNHLAIVAPPKPKPAASSAAATRTRKLAAYLNRQPLSGPKTNSEKDGKVDRTGKVEQVYTYRLQQWGKKHGHYPGTVDKKWGPLTQRCEDALAKQLHA